MSGLLDEDIEDDDATTTTAASTLKGDFSDSESDEEDFEEEHRPRPPPSKLLFEGKGTSDQEMETQAAQSVNRIRPVGSELEAQLLEQNLRGELCKTKKDIADCDAFTTGEVNIMSTGHGASAAQGNTNRYTGREKSRPKKDLYCAVGS